MSFFSDIEGIFDPGGDPEAIRGAAGACRTLASSLREAVAALDTIAQGLQKSWRGIGGAEGQSAAAAFQKAWGKFSSAILDYASGLDQSAARLDQVAAEIQSAQQQATRLKEVALAALAVGAGLTFFTFGISDAAAEASAMADVAVATGLMTSLDAMLADAAAMLEGLLSAFVQVAARFAMGAGFSLTAEMISKLAFGHENPLDPANYSANDISNVLLGGMITAGMGTVISSSTGISGFMHEHPIVGTAASGATGGLLGSAISQFAIQGKKLDASTLEAVAAGTALSAVSGGVIGKLGTMGGPIGKILGTGPAAGDESPISLPEPPVTGDSLDAPVPGTVGPEADRLAADPSAPVTGPLAADPSAPEPPPAQPADSAQAQPAAPEPPPAQPAAPEAAQAQPAAPEAAQAQPSAPEPPPAPPAPTTDAAPPSPAGQGAVGRAIAKAGDITGISKGDVIRGAVGVPVSVLKNELFSGSHPASPAMPQAPSAPPPAPVPHIAPPPPPHAPPPPPPHVPPSPPHVPPSPPHVPPPPPSPPHMPPPAPAQVGGGTVTVQPGDSLYQIAGQRLGNPNLYPLIEAANPQIVGPDGLIMPGQVLRIPVLPALPPHATVQVVQPGQSLWEIAGGNPALVQRIAELNHLADPSLIQPGQVLINPG